LKIAPFFTVLAFGLAAPAIAQAGPQAAPTAPEAAAEAPAAQAAAAKAGDTVYDPAGLAVGTIESVSGANFVLSTGTNKATLPVSALGSGANGPTIGMAKADLEAAIKAANGK
jgi:hypothetical protein